MNQDKIGKFLKELRKEKGLTQEKMAEEFNVSRRTITRWETGSNLPDISILVDISDYYDVDLRELLNGEKRSERMDKELKDTVKKVAEYSNMENKRANKAILIYLIVGGVSLIANQSFIFLDIKENFWTGFVKGATAGLALCSIIFGILYITGRLTKISEAKKRLLKK